MRPKKFLNLAETRIPRIHTNGRLSGVAPAVGPIPLIPVDDLSSRGKDSKAGRARVLPRCGLYSTYATIFGGILPISAFLKISRQKSRN
jgi:hypothetical protein